MKVKPILFNTEMVRALLDGRKSCTRRLVKTRRKDACGFYVTRRKADGLFAGIYEYDENESMFDNQLEPPYQPGDILYVRETWRVGAWDIFNQMVAFDYKDGTCGELTYIQDRELFDRLVNQSRNDARQAKCEYNGVDFVWEKGKSPCRWHPSIHMPKEAARIWLKVTDVRVERLQEITIEGIRNEGLTSAAVHVGDMEIALEEWKLLWNSTVNKDEVALYGWDANPFVWVIEFERCEEPEGDE